jgi:hypothetical protein
VTESFRDTQDVPQHNANTGDIPIMNVSRTRTAPITDRKYITAETAPVVAVEDEETTPVTVDHRDLEIAHLRQLNMALAGRIAELLSCDEGIVRVRCDRATVEIVQEQLTRQLHGHRLTLVYQDGEVQKAVTPTLDDGTSNPEFRRVVRPIAANLVNALLDLHVTE